MGIVIGAGALDQCLTVLELQETTPRVWEWMKIRETWARVTPQSKTNLFSKVGIGARDAAVILRRQPLTLHQAMRWSGRHLFLTAIVPHGRGYLDVSAALVEPVQCIGRPMESGMGQGNRPDRSEQAPIRFPGVLTEKYLGYSREEPHGANTTDLVLVTPKPIVLTAGDLVDIGEETYNVRVVHTLDPCKNEYEVRLGKDV